ERDGDHPFSLLSVYYNDRDGATAMAAHDARDGAGPGGSIPVRGGIEVTVVDEYGGPLPAFSAGGRIYVIGEAGRRYDLRIANRTARRYEAVVSVDGLDVIDGRSASVEKRGYLVAPFATVTIDGFRKSESEVAAFRFGSVRDSYAAKTGSDR